MDILTLVGLLAGIIIVILAMLANASVLTFLNLPGLALVLGGTFAVTLIKFRMPSVVSACLCQILKVGFPQLWCFELSLRKEGFGPLLKVHKLRDRETPGTREVGLTEISTCASGTDAATLFVEE